ncbi:REJ domain-containing protein [Baffinella frigidus]|nr:REJ domain-containing protein [Cryptophyta sp. CCMP2293]
MDASLSFGGGGRPLEYRWAIGFGPSNRKDIASLLAKAPSGSATLTFNATILLPLQTYPFSLSVRNFVGGEAVVSITVTKGAGSVPVVYVAGPMTRRFARSVEVRLVGRSARIPEFYVPSYTLSTGKTYTITLFAATPGGGPATYSVKVEVVSQPVLAVIAGGDRTLSIGTDLILDATASYDPDDSEEPFTYRWTCTSGIDTPEPCFPDATGILVQDSPRLLFPKGYIPDSPRLFFPKGYIPVGTRNFEVGVSKDPGPRTSVASVWIETVSDAVSSVSISTTPKMNADERLVLVGGDLNMSDASLRTTALDTRNLVFRSRVLVEGQTYLFELRGACAGEGFGRALVTVRVASAPLGGTFQAMPKEGVAVETLFTLRCDNWAAEAEDLPLSYLFAATFGPEDRSIALGPRIVDNELRVMLPLDTRALTVLQAWVCDVNRACSIPLYDQVAAWVCDVNRACSIPLYDQVAVRAPTLGFQAAASIASWVGQANSVGNFEQIVGGGGAIAGMMNAQMLALSGRRALTPEESAGDIASRNQSDVLYWRALAPEESAGNIASRNQIIEVLRAASGGVALTTDYVTFVAGSVETLLLREGVSLQSFQETGVAMLREYASAAAPAYALQPSATGVAMLREYASAAAPAYALQPSAVTSTINALSRDVLLLLGQAQLQGTVEYEASVTLSAQMLELSIGRYASAALATTTLKSSTCSSGEGECASVQPPGECASVQPPVQFSALPDTLDVQLLTWGGDRYLTDFSSIAGNITSVRLLSGRNQVTTLDTSRLAEPVLIKMPVTGEAKSSTDTFLDTNLDPLVQDLPICQYWDAATSLWSSRGCIARGNKTTELECECYHLTDFSVMLRQTAFAPDLDFGTSDSDEKPGSLMPGQAIVLIVFLVTTFLGLAFAFLGRFIDHMQTKGFIPSLSDALFSRGYVHGDEKKHADTFQGFSLAVRLLIPRYKALMREYHPIAGIFFRTAKDPFDRPGRIL